MPLLFGGSYNTESEPIIGVIVHPDGLPSRGAHVRGLLDTGADQLVISEHLASLLQLRVVGTEPTNTVSGTTHHPLYKATIVLPAVDGSGQRTFQCQKLVGGT